MKPPKSIRNIVHTLLGRKAKSSLKEPKGGFQDGFLATNANRSKTLRHNRSTDDLLKEGSFDANSNHLPCKSFSSRSQTLPRRSQSCLSVRPTAYRQAGQVSGRVAASGTKNQIRSEIQFERKHIDRCDSISRSHAGASDLKGSISSRITSNISGATMPRTISWSHPGFENCRTMSCDVIGRSDNEMHNKSENMSPREKNYRPLSSCEHSMVGDICQAHWSPTGLHAKAPREETNEKLKTCLHVLDRLSAQVKEIKDVSKRVKYVDTKVKNGTLRSGERERRLRELGKADAASKRLKQLIKSGTESISPSSSSTKYDSEAVQERRSRSRIRMAQFHSDHAPFGDVTDTTHRGSQPYPQSVSDMMPIWDAKDIGACSKHPRERHMTREDSTSSGYATGSGSEDGRQDSPNAIDADSVASVFSMQCDQPQSFHNQEATEKWYQRHFRFPPHQRYYASSHENYDPYEIHCSHPQHVSASSENLYANYADVYGYTPSSAHDEEIYISGWYQIPSSNHSALIQYNHATTAAVPSVLSCNQGWYQTSHAAQPVSTKYGGLSDLFFDPMTQTGTTLMDSVAKEVAMESQTKAEPMWGRYGSFRYRNGQRTVSMPADRKRKTVRFSQTVLQRVETEESELKDSTSVIKGGADGDGGDETKVMRAGDSPEIYMSPKQHHTGEFLNLSAKQEIKTVNDQNSLPEPIYEFPSGHIETSCMCNDCILARGSSQISATEAVMYFQ